MPFSPPTAYNVRAICRAFFCGAFQRSSTIMGIYDRDYSRGDRYGDAPGYHLTGPRTITTKIVIFTSLIYLAQLLTSGWLTNTFELHPDWYRRPWEAYQLLTYGFLHAPDNVSHILFNMLGLWFFGRDVEDKYGPKEFLVFYLTAIVVAGLTWTLCEIPFHTVAAVIGASGGTTAVLILFAFNFPYRTGLFMFLFAMPMWMLAVLVVGIDAVTAMNRFGNVAVTAHLGGAAFAALYYRLGIRLARWLPAGLRLPRLAPRPKLRVHDPEDAVDEGSTDSRDVDDILRKITAQGMDSLTRRERQILEQDSRDKQRKRRGP
jgi:membrane associated rhomboid family serine protease